ncbi:hypothetical protein [Brevundimonas sp.]
MPDLSVALGALSMAVWSLIAPQDPPQTAPSHLPEVVVEGQPVEEQAREFISEIAAPSRGESLARWRGSICIGAAGFDAEGGRFVVDRVSEVAAEMGLTPEEPGCQPDVLILATSDGSRTAQETVSLERSRFRPGGMGFSRTRADLAKFIDTHRPVRWWHTTIPIDPRAERRVRRLPTDSAEDAVLPDEILDNVPQVYVPATLIGPTTRQDMWAGTVIVDFSRVGEVDYNQLADYVAFVALAQVDPEADTSGFPTVLNVFDDPASAPGLTDWDRAYLRGLYDSREGVSGATAREAEIRREMLRARERGQAPSED